MNLISRGRASLTMMATLHRQALCTKMPQNLNQGHRLSEGTLGSRMARRLILAAKLDRESLFPGTHAMEGENSFCELTSLLHTCSEAHLYPHIQNK